MSPNWLWRLSLELLKTQPQWGEQFQRWTDCINLIWSLIVRSVGCGWREISHGAGGIDIFVEEFRCSPIWRARHHVIPFRSFIADNWIDFSGWKKYFYIYLASVLWFVSSPQVIKSLFSAWGTLSRSISINSVISPISLHPSPTLSHLFF